MTFEIENVSKVFESGEGKEDVTALKDINLTIETGEFISFVGPSGCGKTTLLRIIEGFENPTEGTVKDDGKIVTRPSNERGFIFQNYSLYPWLNVIDNVVFGLGINGKPEKESKERAMEYLESVGLKDFANSYPHELSGGMKQRVAIIRSLILNAPILIMDEPFSAIDMLNRHNLQDQLIDIWKEGNSTILFVTHDVDEAVYLADKIVIMDKNPGRIKTILEVPLERPRHRESKEFFYFQDEVERNLGVWES